MSRTRVEILAQNVDIESTLALKDGSTTRLYIDSSGNLAIGNNTSPAGALDVTGNIVVSGTVDGRDVAADGAKLDAIEAGATADQTAAEIKTAYESNNNTNAFTDAEQTKLSGIATGAEVNVNADWNATTGDAVILNKPSIPTDNAQLTNGAGYITSADGGDAGLLDGLDSTQFLRSDADDTTSGALTIKSTVYTHYTNSATDITSLISGSTFGGLIEAPSTGHLVVGLRGNDLGDSFSIISGGGNYNTDSTYDTLVFQAKVNGDLFAGSNKIWHAGNDGSGSGLDADTLDGIQGGSYLRSDVDDTFYGDLEINNASATLLIVDSQGNTYSRIRNSGGTFLFEAGANGIGNTAGAGEIWFTGYGGGNLSDFRVRTGNSYNKIWHAGNDGASSGLDADLLDGQHGSHYLDYNNFTNTPTIPSAYTDSSVDSHLNTSTASSGEVLSWNGTDYDWVAQSGGTTNADTLDNLDSTQFLRSDTTDIFTGGLIEFNNTSDAKIRLQVPSGDTSDWNYIEFKGANGTRDGYVGTNQTGTMQFVQDSGSYLQLSGTAGTANISGNTIWTTGNDGSGSGLDADTVDGIQASSFLRSDASDSYTGSQLAFTASGVSTMHYDAQGWRVSSTDLSYQRADARDDATNYSRLHWYGVSDTGSSSNFRHAWYDGSAYINVTAESGELNFAITSGTTYLMVDSNTVWHTGNDGSGSGLDADTLDGLNGSAFLQRAGGQMSGSLGLNDNVSILFGAGPDLVMQSDGTDAIIQTQNNADIYFKDSGTTKITFDMGNGDITAVGQVSADQILLTGPASNVSGAYAIYASLGMFVSGNEVWHAGNDGSGSGLDADTLDGLQSVHFERKSTATGSTSTAGWYTIAVNAGNRASAKFNINDQTSGAHQSVHFHAAHMYGNGNSITVLSNAYYSTSPIRYIRIKEGGTYDGALLQVYLDSSFSGNWNISENYQSGGWVITSLTADGTDPGTVSNFSALTNVAVQVDVDNGPTGNGGNINTTGEIYAGGTTTQYKVWHAGNDGSGSGLDADTLDGNQASAFHINGSGNSVTAGAVYAYNWFRNYGEEGLYSQSYGQHFYPDSGGSYWEVDGMFRFRDGYEGTIKGYTYWDSSGFGLLSDDGSWAYRHNNTYADIYGTIRQDGSNIVWHAGNDGSGSGLDADNLDGYTWTSSGKNVRASEFYADNWFRNYNNGEGLYNEANTMYWYSNSTSQWKLLSNQNTVEIAFATSGNNVRGYVYANNSNEIGFLNNAHNWTFRVDSSGNVTATGNVTAYSDIRLKSDIKPIADALDKVSQINGVTFTRVDSGERQAGVIAQDVEKVLPEVVRDGEDYKSVAYGNMVGLLVEAIKEQQATIQKLTERIEVLEGGN